MATNDKDIMDTKSATITEKKESVDEINTGVNKTRKKAAIKKATSKKKVATPRKKVVRKSISIKNKPLSTASLREVINDHANKIEKVEVKVTEDVVALPENEKSTDNEIEASALQKNKNQPNEEVMKKLAAMGLLKNNNSQDDDNASVDFEEETSVIALQAKKQSNQFISKFVMLTIAFIGTFIATDIYLNKNIDFYVENSVFAYEKTQQVTLNTIHFYQDKWQLLMAKISEEDAAHEQIVASISEAQDKNKASLNKDVIAVVQPLNLDKLQREIKKGEVDGHQAKDEMIDENIAMELSFKKTNQLNNQQKSVGEVTEHKIIKEKVAPVVTTKKKKVLAKPVQSSRQYLNVYSAPGYPYRHYAPPPWVGNSGYPYGYYYQPNYYRAAK